MSQWNSSLLFARRLKWWYMGRNTVLFYRKDDRLPAWMLWSHIVWVLIRESLKGNATLLPAYWQGVQSGLEHLRVVDYRPADRGNRV